MINIHDDCFHRFLLRPWYVHKEEKFLTDILLTNDPNFVIIHLAS